MSIGTDPAKGTAEAAKAARDAVRHYTDESVVAGRAYIASLNAAAHAGMRTAFDLQNASIQASRGLVDAMIQANNKWFDQSVEAMRKTQEVGSKLVGATLEMIESSIPSNRA